MKLIKLNAIDSTNDFLKNLNSHNIIENFTVVVAENQMNGKGQMGSQWQSEAGKNLTFSILIKKSVICIEDIYGLNVIVALQVIEALKKYKIPDLSIKWPNDIMSDNKKIGGILIENSILQNGTIDSVIGIGINLNQTDFEGLPKGSSVYNIIQKKIDKLQLLKKIVRLMETAFETLNNERWNWFWNQYNDILFRKNTPTVFQDNQDIKFMGLIKNVNRQGKIEIMMEDDSIKTFNIKEIKMLY